MMVKLCYAPINQVDRAWRKTVDNLMKDKTCQFKVVVQPNGVEVGGTGVHRLDHHHRLSRMGSLSENDFYILSTICYHFRFQRQIVGRTLLQRETLDPVFNKSASLIPSTSTTFLLTFSSTGTSSEPIATLL
ncbi:unnamed protein product [Camellia sinensis]